MFLSQKMQNLRKLNGLSQEELGEKLNVSRQAISKWESDQSIPELEKIIAMSELFNVSTDYLLKDKEEGSETNIVEEKSDMNLKRIEQSTKQIDKNFIAGLVLFTLGFLSIITFWIIYITSRTNYISYSKGINCSGFKAFLDLNDGLEVIFVICYVIILIGIILMCHNLIVKLFKLKISKLIKRELHYWFNQLKLF